MARCRLTQEDECHGTNCIDRVGTPCVFDNQLRAGTEDLDPEFDEFGCPICDGINGSHIHGCPAADAETWETLTDAQKDEELGIVRDVYGHLSDPL